MKSFLASNALTWVAAIVISLLSFMWTQSGRIASLEAKQPLMQDQLNRMEEKLDYVVEHLGGK
jgi:hypothetical protein